MKGTKELIEITQQDLDDMKRHKTLLQYTQTDIYNLDALIKQYVNQFHRTCLGCSGSALRDAKDQINNLLAAKGDEMQGYIDKRNKLAAEPESDVEAAKKQVKTHKKVKKDDNQ